MGRPGSLCVASCAAILAALASAHDAIGFSVTDTIYVRTMTEGEYKAVAGQILRLNQRTLVFQTDSGVALYVPDAVKHVDLGAAGSASSEPGALTPQAVVDVFWNRDTPFPVAVFQTIPFLGGLLKAIDKAWPAASGACSVILSLALLVWGVLRVQELFVTSRENQRLSRLKLELDLLNARYQTRDLRAKWGDHDEIDLDAMELPLLHRYQRAREAVRAVQSPLEQSQDFAVPRWTRAFVSKRGQSRAHELAIAEWSIRLGRSAGAARRRRATRWATFILVSLLLTYISAIFGLMSTSAASVGGELDFGSSVFYAVIAIVGFLFVGRRIVSWRVETIAYRACVRSWRGLDGKRPDSHEVAPA